MTKTVYTVYIQMRERYEMEIIISNAANKPIYEQIVEQVKQKIMNGILREGDMLPSIRALAKDLRISVITTKRAYEELEREGYVVTMPGKGCFVAAQGREWIKEGLLREIEIHLTEIKRLSELAGISGEELCCMLRILSEEE